MESYKGRTVDYGKPVYIYRNLHKKGTVYSVRQNGLIIGHTSDIKIFKVKFIVNKAGRARVLQEKRKNVHAFIKGYVEAAGVQYPVLSDRLVYNPYKGSTFMRIEKDGLAYAIHAAEKVLINDQGVWV